MSCCLLNIKTIYQLMNRHSYNRRKKDIMKIKIKSNRKNIQKMTKNKVKFFEDL